MPETVSIDDVARMLDVARFHLRRFEAEHSKLTGRDQFAMEAYLIACLQVGGSVFYTLANPRKHLVNPFADKVRTWKADLEKARKYDYDFFFRMIEHRDSAVHVSTVATEVAMSAIPAHRVPNVEVFAPPGTTTPNPVPGGSPAFAPAWVIIAKLRLDGTDALTTCKRFLNLLDELVKYCRAP